MAAHDPVHGVVGFVLALLALESYAPIALVFGIGVGPLVAALIRCTVCLVRDGELGSRLQSRAYGCIGSAGSSSGAGRRRRARRAGGGTQLRLVGRRRLAAGVRRRVPARVFLMLQLLLSPLVVAERKRPLRGLLTDAGTTLVRRPAASSGSRWRCCVIDALGAPPQYCHCSP